MEIRSILKNARKTRELTLKDVAKATGIPLTTINSWERGSSYPRGKNRDIIATYYKLPKESLDYAAMNPDTGSRQFNVGQITQDLAMAEYETQPIMLHKSYWEMAREIQKREGDADFNEMFARLIKAAK